MTEFNLSPAKLFQALEPNLPIGITAIDLQGRQIYVNAAFCRMVGWTQEELLGKTGPFIYWSREHIPEIQASLKKTLDGNPPPEGYHFWFQRKNGEVFPIRLTPAPLTSNSQNWGLVALVSDITRQHAVEASLLESDHWLKESQRISHSGNYIVDIIQGTWNADSPTLDDIFGITPDYPRTVPGWLQLIHPDHRESMVAYIQNEVIRQKQPLNRDFKILRPSDGQVRWIHGQGELFCNQEGKPVKLAGVMQDITERKLAEELLAVRSREWQAMFDAVSDVVWLLDIDGTIRRSNQATFQLLGQEPAAVIGRHCCEVVHGAAERIEECPVRRLLHSKQREGMELRYGQRWFSVTVDPVFNEAGGIIQIVHIMRDITEKQKTESALRDAQRLESIGMLAGGIAHDFNNLLHGLFGYLEMALANAEGKDAQRSVEYLQHALKVYNRAKDLTQQLLTFAKGGVPVRKLQAVDKLLLETVHFVLSGSNVSAHFSIASDLWHTNIDENQISQVLDNLVVNARQAMPHGGVIAVEAENLPADRTPPSLPHRDFIRIAITDSGSGITPENQVHIFEPFFTTKAEGSGLGLATAYSIVNKHEGVIDVVSEPGHGTTVSIYLPGSSAQPLVPTTPRSTKLYNGTGKILLMDDEPAIRDTVSAMLRHLGFSPFLAEKGNEAIQKVREAVLKEDPFTAAILDLTIPNGLGGKDAAQMLLAIDPSLKIIASSGYSEDPVMSQPRDFGFAACLIKPYTLEELSQTLRSVIER
jgi:PAS domain S-box-containing protein